MYPVGVYETSKSINESFYNMRCLVLFTTAVCFIFLLTMCKCNIFINAAVCVLFLIKLRRPKSKSIYETTENSVAMPPPLSPTICSFSLNILKRVSVNSSPAWETDTWFPETLEKTFLSVRF